MLVIVFIINFYSDMAGIPKTQSFNLCPFSTLKNVIVMDTQLKVWHDSQEYFLDHLLIKEDKFVSSIVSAERLEFLIPLYLILYYI